MVLNLDFAPTLLDLAGTVIPGEMQGQSFRGVLEGKVPHERRAAMYYHYYGQYGVEPHYGLRTPTHKLIYFYGLDAWELFDLERDPCELNNVYDDPALADVAGRLKAELEGMRARFGDQSLANVFRNTATRRVSKGG